MALVNHAKKEINAKIVYYGPPGIGKGTALSYVYSRIKPSLRGDLKSVPAGADNLLFFDFSPFEAPLAHGYRVCLHVYTLTGIVTNPATWKMTLKGADGIIIMVNPAAKHFAEARENVSQLRDYLSAYGVGLHDTPAVLQLNSFSGENRADEAVETAATLDLDMVSTCCSNTATGEGLLEALTTLSRQVLDRISVKNEPSGVDEHHESPQATAEAALPPTQKVPAAGKNVHETTDVPYVALISEDVVSENNTIRIPLEIGHGAAQRRVVVTVNLEMA